MSIHIREWRLHRGLTLEQVGNSLGVEHTTVGRWEKKGVKLSLEILERLAEIYDATPKQLQAPPSHAQLVSNIDAFQQSIDGLDQAMVDHILAVVAGLAKR